MFRLWTIMKKEMLHIWRDPRTLALIILLPAVLLLLLGYGISGETMEVPMAVVDYSRTAESREFIDKFTSSKDFAWRYTVDGPKDIYQLILQDQIKVGLIIPEEFGRKVATHEQVRVQVLVDGSTNPTDAMTIQLKLNAISAAVAQDLLIEQLSRTELATRGGLDLPVDASVQTLYNPDGKTALYMIPGLIPIILQVQTLLLSAMAIVREREQGTMEQLIVTPIKAWELMLGKIIPYLVVCMLDLFIMLGLAKLMFDVQVMGSLGDLVWLSAIFILGSLGMGVLISNISQTQMQAVYVAMFIVVIPAIILSGLMFSRENMPAFTYWYSEFLPVTQYLEISRALIVRGAEASTLLFTSTIPMIVMSVVYFVASIFAFRKHI